MINVKDNDIFIKFSSIEDKLQKLKEWDLIGKKDYQKLMNGEKIKPIMYKGIFSKVEIPCEIIGYITDKTKYDVYEICVIYINGENHKINPMYLKQMQSKDFGILSSNEEG